MFMEMEILEVRWPLFCCKPCDAMMHNLDFKSTLVGKKSTQCEYANKFTICLCGKNKSKTYTFSYLYEFHLQNTAKFCKKCKKHRNRNFDKL